MTGEWAFVAPASPDWVETLDAVPHDVYHVPGYSECEVDVSSGSATAFVFREGQNRLIVPLIIRPVPGTRWVDAVSPYGYPGPASNAPLGDTAFWTAACRSLLAGLRDMGAVSCFVRLNPLLPTPHETLAEVGLVVPHGRTVALDLNRPLSELEHAFRGDHRSQIRRARRAGLRVVIDDWDHMAEFVSIYHETMERVGAAESYFFPSRYFDRLRASLGPDLHLASVVGDGEVKAAGLFFEREGIVQYHLSGTRQSARSRQPTKLMVADMVAWAQARGNRVFHLGGGIGGREDSLFHFKEGFSDWLIPFCTWRIVVDEVAYQQATDALAPAGEDGGSSGYFPAYRAPGEARA